jgi:hypothetical protein
MQSGLFIKKKHFAGLSCKPAGAPGVENTAPFFPVHPQPLTINTHKNQFILSALKTKDK